MLDYSPKQPAGSGSLEGLLEEKVACLAKILAQVQEEIVERGELSQRVIETIRRHYCVVSTAVREVEHVSQAEDGGQRRSMLSQQLDVLKAEERRERVSAWQDTAQLKSEFRRWFKDFSDLRQRAKLLAPAMDVGEER